MDKKKEECQQFATKIQSMFPDVNMISSDEFVAMSEADHDNILLVDVRSQAEQDVSILEGGIPLSQLENPSKLPSGSHVVTYCTVGFRACLEARRLKEENPSLKVSCLDGIACYTHATGGGGEGGISSRPRRRIIEPTTGQDAKQVHTFGKQWACLSDKYEPVHFSPLMYSAQSAWFGAGFAWKTLKSSILVKQRTNEQD